MTSCYHCTARFSSDPATEQQWREMHTRRFHQETRATSRGLDLNVVDAASAIVNRRRGANFPTTLSA